jgi:TolC family type I secretion outer membrane protein
MTMISFRRVLMSAVAVSVMTFGTAIVPQVASAQSLQEALAEAYRTNPTLQARRAQLRATDESVPQAKAGWRPTVELIGDINGLRSETSSRVTSSKSTRFTSGIELQVKQNVYDGGGTQAAVEGAKADVLAQRADLVAVEQSILLQGVTAYMDVLRDEAVVDLNSQNVTRLERQLEATRDRYDAGVATLTDSAQAESRLARSRSDLAAARGDLEVSRSIFEELIGAPPTTLSRPTLVPDLPEGRDAAKTMAVSNNPSVLTALYNRRAALHSIDQEYADLLPSVDIIGAAGKDWDKTSDGSRATTAQITAQVTVPIYQQGFATSQVRQSKMTAGQTLMQIEVARRDASEQAISAWETYQSVVSTIVAIREEVRAAEIALDGVRQEELVGQRTLLDVLDAEQELLDAKVSLERAQRDETVARFQLVAAIGSLTAQDLGLDVPVYNPSSHYDDVKDTWWGVGDDVERVPSDSETMSIQP